MLQGLDSSNWMLWAAGLMVGFPAAVMLLSELAYKLRRSGRTHLVTAIDLFRNSTLFLLFCSVLLRIVIGLPADHIAIRLVDTALWITVINLALAVFNLAFFSGAEGTWRAQVPKLLVDLSRVFIVLVCAAFIVSTIWGLDLKAMLAALGVGSLVIGLALQDTLGNLFSGIAVVSGRQIKNGDWLKIGDIEGQVRAINWRTTTIATSTGDFVVIPNGQIARERVRIFGADRNAHSVLAEFKIPNDQPPQPVLDLMLSTARSSTGVMTDPAPLARIASFDDYDIAYRTILYVDDYARVNAVRTEFLANFWYAAERAGISLPPRQVLAEAHFKAHSRTIGSHVDEGTVINKLLALDLFKSAPEYVAKAAGSCRIEPYRRRQILLSAGERSATLFVVLSGRAAAYFVHGGERTLVEEFNPGELVLYKAFFRNGPSPFEVGASSELEAISFPVAVLEELLASKPDIGSEVERLLSLREEAVRRAAAKTIPSIFSNGADTSREDILRQLFRG